MTAIEMTGLAKHFRVKGSAAVEAVKGLSLKIELGEVFGFLGPNGAGKSTTIKMLMGLIHPTGGTVSLMGEPASSPLSRRRVGYLPENPAFYDYLTASEYLHFVGRTFRMSGSLLDERITAVLKLLELWDARNRPLRGYSKGMVQRLGIAQTMVHDPDVYVLDEPMSGLDPLGRALVKNIILDLRKKGKSVFFSTHITADVESVCDRVGIILRGTLRKLDRVDSIMAEGLIGYHVRICPAGSQERVERFVPKEGLPEFLQETLRSGGYIEFIEPKRKNLESFFLDVVKGTTD